MKLMRIWAATALLLQLMLFVGCGKSSESTIAMGKHEWAAALNSDAKNAYTAAQVFFVDNPKAVADCSDLLTAGYTPTAGVTCASTITQTAGAITVTAPVARTVMTRNVATVTFSGAFTPAAP